MKVNVFRIAAALGVVTATALLLVATSSGSGSAATTLRGVVGPSFTIKLTKNDKVVKSLKAGTYKITVNDRSAEHNFVLARQGGATRQITSVGFVGTKTVTVSLAKGVWRFFCAPHASVMVGRVAVGGAVLGRAATTVADDHGNGREAEPGDDRGGNGEVEAGDDRGGHGEPEPGDDRGGHGEPEPGDDHGGHDG